MRILRWLLLFSLTSLAAAQFTTVTGTVLDPSGIPYANGTITAQLVLAGTTPTINGGSFSMQGSAGLNGAGSFTMRLADSLVMTPNANWSFTVCSGAGTVQPAGGTGPQCFTPAAITITGASQSITAQLHAAALALALNPGTVTSIATTAPLSGGPITGAGAIACATCAIGPGVSVAGNSPSFVNTDGVTLADSGTKVAPIFSTAATGVSMANSGVNTVLTGPTTMVTPAADGTYRFVIQLTQTASGSGGTCNASSTLGVNLSYKDADTGLTYAAAATGMIVFGAMNSGSVTATPGMTNGSVSQGNNFTSLAREFRAAAGVAVRYQVFQGTNSNCNTPPVFTARPALYFVGY